MAALAPPRPSSTALTDSQWATFYAFTEVVVPVLQPAALSADTSAQALSNYAASSASASSHAFRNGVEKLFECQIPAHSRASISTLLNLLNSTHGCYLATYASTPFHLLSFSERERLILWWTSPTSYLLFPPMRQFALSIISMAKVYWLRKNAAELIPAIGYDSGVGRVNAWAKSDSWKKDVRSIPEGEENGFYDRWDFITPKIGEEFNVDVVIIGSGAGGGVAAKIIAEAGLSVIVVEKGTWYPASDLPLPEDSAAEFMFEAGLSSTSDDGSMAIIAASTFGGGTTVNWAASLQTPCYVRREWAEKHKLPFFQSGTFQRHLDEVSSRMGVSLPASQNHRNTTLLSGGHKLGFTSATVPQNAPPTHADPWCSFGCGCPPNSRKMGGTHTWLPDASRAGARFMTEFTAQSLVFSDVSKKRAIGVRGIYGPLKTPVTIKAREVVVAAGTLNTPSLLTNSGLRNSHIGANLFLHPTTMVYARFPERTNPSTGSPLTAIITSFDNLNKSGHGVRIETPIMSLATGLFLLPWAGGEQFKKDVLTYQHIDNYICIVRDKNPGRVRRDQEGKLKITYTASREEKSWMMEGIQAACKTAYVQGADKIWAPVVGFPPFLRNAGVATRVDDVLTSSGLDLDDPGVLEGRFSKWLAEVRSMGLPNPGTMWGSAHQMSSCRMSATKSDGVVDPYGRVWGTKGLSIADASILPTASGVNPMITVMATAAWVAENVVERLKRTA